MLIKLFFLQIVLLDYKLETPDTFLDYISGG